MEHCAKSKNASKLSFVRAVCTQENLPYIFKKLEGTFAEDNRYGIIETNGFSGLTIAQEESDEREYGARTYSIYEGITSYRIDFVVTWNTEAHLTVSVSSYNTMQVHVPVSYTHLTLPTIYSV